MTLKPACVTRRQGTVEIRWFPTQWKDQGVNAACGERMLHWRQAWAGSRDWLSGRGAYLLPVPLIVDVPPSSPSMVSTGFGKLPDLCAQRDGDKSEMVRKVRIGWAIGSWTCGMRGLRVREHT